MARNEITIDASADRVWATLADARNYGHWVVGSSRIRKEEPGFPAPGTKFHHKVGWGPFKLSDHTEVLSADPGRCLELKAKARPFGTALVRLLIDADGAARSRVTMIEDPGDRISRTLDNPLAQLLLRLRNRESLRRLKAIAEGRGPSPEDAARP